VVFTVEFCIRLSCCRRRLVFISNPLNIVDVLSFMPFYIELSGTINGVGALRVVRTIRLSRLIRMLKLGFFSDYMQIFSDTLKFSKHSFGMLGFLLLFPVVIFACFAFSVEHEPSSYSIFDAFYFVLVTITTLGYGDNHPRTVIGKLIACTTVMIGIIYLTFAIHIIGACFDQAYGNYLTRVAERKRKTAQSLAREQARKHSLDSNSCRRLAAMEAVNNNLSDDVSGRDKRIYRADGISYPTEPQQSNSQSETVKSPSVESQLKVSKNVDDLIVITNDLTTSLQLLKEKKVSLMEARKDFFEKFALLGSRLDSFANL